MLDQRTPFWSYDKRLGSTRDAVKLREFWESAVLVKDNASAMAPLPSERVSSSPAFTHFVIGRCLYGRIPPQQRLTFALSRKPVLA